MENGIITFPQWHGELGWEVASWVPWCRKRAEGYQQVVVSSFGASRALYADFATDFIDHGGTGRGLDYPKKYRPDGKYVKYGRYGVPFGWTDILIHGRGISRKSSINYRHWDEFLDLKKKLPFTASSIGSMEDVRVGELPDFRGLEMSKLMDLIASAKLVIGVSSGIMHLAAFCGTDIVTWGDRRTYFGETLEARYKITWNPFNVRVGWIDADDFQPSPQQIIEKVKEILDYDKSFIEKYAVPAG